MALADWFLIIFKTGYISNVFKIRNLKKILIIPGVSNCQEYWQPGGIIINGTTRSAKLSLNVEFFKKTMQSFGKDVAVLLSDHRPVFLYSEKVAS